MEIRVVLARTTKNQVAFALYSTSTESNNNGVKDIFTQVQNILFDCWKTLLQCKDVDVTFGRLVTMQKEQIKKIFLGSSKTDSPS